MSADETPKWEEEEEEKSTGRDLLAAEEAARKCLVHVTLRSMITNVVKDDSLAECQDRIGETEMRISAAGASAMYSADSMNFGKVMSDKLEMPASPPERPEMDVPFIECHFRNTQTPGAAPIGVVEHYTYVKEKSRKGNVEEYYQKDLYFFWPGSQSYLDWACDADANLTSSQHPDVQIHGGMFSRFNEFKDDLEAEMVEFIKQDNTKYEMLVNPRRIFFAGHSLGAGLAQVSHFQLYAAQEDGHWPSSKALRDWARDSSNGVFMIGLAGPPVFHIKGDQSVTIDAIKLTSERGVNVTMEYDAVPRMMNVPYCKQVLKSCAQGKIDLETDSPLVKVFVARMAQYPLAAMEKQLDTNAAIMKSFQHVHPIVVNSYEKNEKIWKWTVITPKLLDDYAKFEWPYENSKSGSMSTLMPVADHTVFPGKIDTTWTEDVCCLCGLVPDELDAKWKDCMHCQATFCAACYERQHRDPARGEIVSWHKPNERSLKDTRPGRIAFGLHSVDANQYMNQIRYRAMLSKMAGDVFKPGNIWFVADLIRDGSKMTAIANELCKAGSNFAQAGQVVCKTFGPAEAIIVGFLAVAETGWLIYKRWSTGDLDCEQFWIKLSGCWAGAIGSLGGMLAGAWIGALIGTIFGPVGAVVGGLIGSAFGGAAGGAAFRYGTEELIKWSRGLNPEQKEKANWGIISNAMLQMNLNMKPSQLGISDLRAALRRQALIYHPDKTGLCGKAHLSPEEQEMLKKTGEKYHEIQTHFDTLSAFINARTQEGSKWTESLLTSLDDAYDKMKSEFVKIDKQSQQRKEAVMRAVM